ncbi:MAG: NAD-dependent deacylase [Bacteroidetes bacterium]|nr:MAG: NAD-dependent deacylase [Bacteroidota bacterium]
MKKKLVVLTGAGMSAESGIKTFRDSDGLWENHDVMEVASIDGWRKNPQLVMEFYNQRRKQLFEVVPNAGHIGLAELEQDFDVHIITQNVDDLHERAGSTNIIHLHGELKKVRSIMDEELVYTLDGWELKMGDTAEDGAQLRPHIVWFGEEVPMMENAAVITYGADILVVIGTSLQVYPAAGLMHYAPAHIPKFLIDPKGEPVNGVKNLTVLNKTATEGVAELKILLSEL